MISMGRKLAKQALAASLLVAWLVVGPASARPVLMISIDGLRPGDVLQADQRGLKVPNLRRFVAEGAYARAVVGVLPTLTYPSHVTLITGVAPARSGVVSNLSFDPTGINQDGWDWYARDIQVPTLWEMAHAAGIRTANVHWPVSVAAKGLDENLPQIWRTGHPDDDKLLHALATPGLLERLEAVLGAYARGIDEEIGGDENRGAFAARIIADDRPGFITVYLAALDTVQHAFGPDTPQAHAVLERIDAVVGRLIAAERRAAPDADVVVVSDHGFAPVDTHVNLLAAFQAADLVQMSASGKVTAWEATPWNSGGSAAIMLARPDDPALVGRVRALLAKLAADPKLRIHRVIERSEIARMGGNPSASFYVDFEPGVTSSSTGTVAGPSLVRGMHGYFPGEHPEMASTFLILGPHLPRRGDLGVIDMRQIAPTVARILGVSLPQAEKPPVF